MKVFNYPLVILTVVVIFAGCSAKNVHSTYRFSSDPMDKKVAERTRTVKLYQQFDTVMIADVVLLDESMRRDKDDDSKDATNFLMAIYTSKDEWNDFTRDSTRWSVTLKEDGNVSEPIRIEKAQLNNLTIRDHLPFNPTFRKLYKVSFSPAANAAAKKTLTIKSVLGEVELNW